MSMLFSVQVASGCTTVKPWGIHSVAEWSTVHDVYITLEDGMLEGSHDWEFPQRLTQQPHRSFVGRGQTSEIQSVMVTAKIGEFVQLFGLYVKYLVQTPAKSSIPNSRSQSFN